MNSNNHLPNSESSTLSEVVSTKKPQTEAPPERLTNEASKQSRTYIERLWTSSKGKVQHRLRPNLDRGPSLHQDKEKITGEAQATTIEILELCLTRTDGRITTPHQSRNKLHPHTWKSYESSGAAKANSKKLTTSDPWSLTPSSFESLVSLLRHRRQKYQETLVPTKRPHKQGNQTWVIPSSLRISGRRGICP